MCKTDKGELKKDGYLKKIILIWCKMSKNVKLMHPRYRKVMENRKEMGNNQGAIHIRKSFKTIQNIRSHQKFLSQIEKIGVSTETRAYKQIDPSSN